MPLGELLLLALLFLTAATVYSSVGFGGGSAYLAILAFSSVPTPQIAVVALACNIIVAGRAARTFVRAGHLDLIAVAATVPLSVIAAFIGGTIVLHDHHLRIITGGALAAAAIAMMSTHGRSTGISRHWLRFAVVAVVAPGLGFLAGVIGIGGGVFLSPALHLITRMAPRSAAATAAIFITCNSAAALVGKTITEGSIPIDPLLLVLLAAVFAGGWYGSRLGASRFEPLVVRRLTAVVVALAAANLIVTA